MRPPNERYCVRCGIDEEQVKKRYFLYGCWVYGKSFGKHSYITDRELEKWEREHEAD